MNQIPEPLPDLDLSPKWQRAVHFVVDRVLAYFVGGLALAMVLSSWPLPLQRLDPLLSWFEGLHRVWQRMAFMFLYYLIFEVGLGTTVGKLLTGSAVCDAMGNPPTRNRMLLRTLCRLNPFDWLTFFDRDGKGFHDSFSRTYVIRRRSLKREPAAQG